MDFLATLAWIISLLRSLPSRFGASSALISKLANVGFERVDQATSANPAFITTG